MTKQTANLKKPSWKTRRWVWIVPVVIVVCGIIIILGIYLDWFSNPSEETPTPSPVQAGSKLEDRITEPQKAPVAVSEKIKQEKEEDLSSATKERKEEFGLKKSVDIVVKPGESIRIGKEEIPLNKILAEIEKQKKEKPLSPKTFLRQLKIPEEDIKAGETLSASLAEDRIREDKNQTQPTEKPGAVAMAEKQPEKTAPAEKSGFWRIINRVLGKSTEETPSEEKAAERSAPAREAQKSVAQVVRDKTAPDSEAETPPSSADAGRVESAVAKLKKEPINYYGIYVVKVGDNLWNIHFAFLREYMGNLGIEIAAMDDEPIGSHSSGVGRILKYAENMVFIFNLKTKELSEDLNMLEPAEKIIIFNLPRLHSTLGSLTAEQLKTVRFDGRDLILF
ncbi:MAG: hypothetical protein V3V76_01010 [Candidatus Adiutricales bacterium]